MSERIASPQKTKEIIQKYNFYFRKNFGQNFLIDTHVLDKIIASAEITEEDCILEVGPGIGSLTQAMAEKAGKVVAVEIDTNLLPILKDTLQAYDNIEIINQDILKVDVGAIIKEKNGGKTIKVVANLPYYITTPIIMELLEKQLPIHSITVMVQKEVAERMGAVPGTKDYGALSVAVQYYTEPYIVANVPQNCFMPRPNVSSAVIQLKVQKEPRISVRDETLLFRIVKAAFGQRRKTLMNSLYNQAGLALTKEELIGLLNQAGLEEKVRGEMLSIDQFGVLADTIYGYIRNKI